MDLTIQEKFAQYVVDTNYHELPDDVNHQAKRCILDFLGVALGGSNLGLAPVMTSLIKDMGGKEEATVCGDGMKLPAYQAALVNGVKGHPLDMDDGHRYANGHPGVAVIPAALAVAEREQASGKDLMEAVVVGYELFIRIAKALNPSHLGRGFHTTGTIGPFGAAAACSKLLGLNKTEVANAISIAGLEGSGLLEVSTSGQHMKPLHPGRAAQAGVLASLLSKEDVRGPDLIFEGEKGFCRAYTDLKDLEEIKEGLFNGLGQIFEIKNCYFKLYPACRHVHPSLDAVKEIVRQNTIDINDITKIRVRTYSVANYIAGNKEAKTGLAAKFSIPVSLGLLLAYGKAGNDEYTEEGVNNPLVQKLSQKVDIEVDEEMDAVFPGKRRARLEIVTGKEAFAHEVDIPRGEPENPVSDDELKDKFYDNGSQMLPRETLELLQKNVFDLDRIGVDSLMRYVK